MIIAILGITGVVRGTEKMLKILRNGESSRNNIYIYIDLFVGIARHVLKLIPHGS